MSALWRFLLNWESSTLQGEVSERFKEHAWKACVGEILPWVRIPPSPPDVLNQILVLGVMPIIRQSGRILAGFP